MYDISKYIQPLSFEIKNEILKYLYFSDIKSDKIKSINKFINDFDTVVMRGYCENDDVRIGFGQVKTQLLPVFDKKKSK